MVRARKACIFQRVISRTITAMPASAARASWVSPALVIGSVAAGAAASNSALSADTFYSVGERGWGREERVVGRGFSGGGPPGRAR